MLWWCCCFLSTQLLEAAERELQWSGRTWIVKSSAGGEKRGPGPNAWSSDKKSVWVDRKGRLHLRIRHDGQRWLCAEIRSKKPCGFGTYSCTVESNMQDMDKQMVFGFFAYADDQHEVDMEYSAWSKNTVAQEQFVVQPAHKKGHLFAQKYSGPKTTYQLQWYQKSIMATTVAPSTPVAQKKTTWNFTGSVPSAQNAQAKTAHMHLNLWLFKGRSPQKTYEVIISAATFTQEKN